MYPGSQILAVKFDVHLPGEIHLNDQHVGIILILMGIWFSFGKLTSYKSFPLTRWLDVEWGHRPATGFERFLAIAACIGFGVYLLLSK